MATIFQKITGDNCLILDPREALVYPFSFGGQWTEVRMAMFVSLCSSNGDNTPPPFSIISDSSPSNKFYFGFKTNNNIFPQTPNTLYVGAMSQQDEGTIIASQGANGIRVGSSASNSLSFVYNYNNDFNHQNAVLNPMLSPVHMDLDTGYFGFYSIKLSITPQNVFSGANAIIDVIPGADSSISALRLTATNATYGTVTTGFFTQDSTITGLPAARPDAIFAYLPMFDSRMRIHNILIEKYR